ncbi:Complement C1q tumor necrosis factor-related protein 3 [Acipenser ruthenus]|uniref:Complement C1q tumor necrosis factor-related protein 3 n=1 Tax=Acipenser ruthenus TaxID=7906 RepID=A0A662YYI8_ACIRT|nr:Complement C1q tumor necrosis factor-related protein 3 [Acipenser ruthenus]
MRSIAKKSSAEKPKIAFSASLFDGNRKQLGPFNTAIAIVYPDIRTNVGNCFNVHTGIFTATVKGVYYFSYTAYTAHSINTFVSLTKNGKTVASLWDTDQNDTSDSGSNSAVLELEVGDSVYMKLHENKQLFDDSARYNSFSGFLLFPL